MYGGKSSAKTLHPYAMGDKQFFDALIKPYTCLVGIYVKLK